MAAPPGLSSAVADLPSDVMTCTVKSSASSSAWSFFFIQTAFLYKSWSRNSRSENEIGTPSRCLISGSTSDIFML